ncbi:hypothetical protein BCR32DRAFT_266662 [Anaeromyces robustus]|uniref:Carbohydrate esterase family 16 protein n=1 Tax=Anaeromyces robustus TaxID=1754192 RepID=A0A1Y1XDZ5_9FUNG|nr:hypothetical protein BCR32DRAFT_266662 [Anaeromyces robustus]|eukprot:ORX83937.1 hypothetical protein BCR32DRAFT_266662 [Anaeromyces robustus]
MILNKMANISLAASVEGKKSSITLLSKINPFQYDSITELIVFGDSLSSDDTNFRDMSMKGTNRSLGKNWPIQLTELHNMQLWNFAISGSVIDPDVVPRPDFLYSYRDQCRLYMDRMPKGKIYSNYWTGENTLFAFWLGTNDIMNLNRTLIPPNKINRTLETLNDIFMTSIEDFYITGARNFLFLNVQSIDEIPKYFSEPKLKYDFDLDVDYFNKYFIHQCQNFHDYHIDTNIFIYNIKDEIRYIMDHYKDYNYIGKNFTYDGRKNIENGLNKSIEEFIWTDELHTTYKTNKIFSVDIDELLNEKSYKSNVQKN